MYLLFDIGGTKTRVAVSKDLDGLVGEPAVFETPDDFEEGVNLIIENASRLSGGAEFKSAAGGFAGPLNREREAAVNSPNNSNWVGKPLKERLQEKLDAPVYLENDTALAALAESILGEGRKYRITAYVNIGTGIGGARIINDRIDESVFGFEPGHQFVDIFSEENLKDNKPLTLEEMISGSAVEKRMGKKPYEIEDLNFWREEARILAYGLNNIIAHWSPEAVILGGSMIKKSPGIKIEEVREFLSSILKIYPEIPKIKLTELDGDKRGLYGAMEHLKRSIKIDD